MISEFSPLVVGLDIYVEFSCLICVTLSPGE